MGEPKALSTSFQILDTLGTRRPGIVEYTRLRCRPSWEVLTTGLTLACPVGLSLMSPHQWLKPLALCALIRGPG